MQLYPGGYDLFQVLRNVPPSPGGEHDVYAVVESLVGDALDLVREVGPGLGELVPPVDEQEDVRVRPTVQLSAQRAEAGHRVDVVIAEHPLAIADLPGDLGENRTYPGRLVV